MCKEAEASTNGVNVDTQSLASTEDYSVADSGHGLSEDSDHIRLQHSVSTFRPRWKQQPQQQPPRSVTPRTRSPGQTAGAASSDDTGIYIVETAERRANDPAAGGAASWTTTTATAHPSYGNNLASGCANPDKLSRGKSWWQPASTSVGSEASDYSPSTTQLKRTSPSSVPPTRTAGRGVERSLKKNNEDHHPAATNNRSGAPASSSLPPVPPPGNADGRRIARTPPSPRTVQSQGPRTATTEQSLSPVASSTDANVSDLDSSTSGSFLVLGPHGASRLTSAVSEL